MSKYFYTIKNLKPIQIEYQIINRLFRDRGIVQLKRLEGIDISNKLAKVNILIPELDLDEKYLSRFDYKELLDDSITLLHEHHDINYSTWNESAASHLWNFNLHYLEYLIVLAAEYDKEHNEIYFDKWKEIVLSWMDIVTKDAYAAYTISLRIPNLLIQVQLFATRLNGTEFEKKLYESIYKQYRVLIQTQEKALLANHYFENLKTIVICSVLFNEKHIYKKYFRKLKEEIEEQILLDGMHYERSLMYHKIILEDILRVFCALQNKEDKEILEKVIRKMSDAIASLEKGTCQTPLFNDAGNNVAKSKDELLRAVYRLIGYEANSEISAFAETGYFKIYDGNKSLLFDCGEIGPSYMGGHAHNDCLSFELSINDMPLFVNAGTYQYQSELRSFFRSTIAHNTLQVDNEEQSELWGEHRVARRGKKYSCFCVDGAIIGSFISYRGIYYRRKVIFEHGCLLINDHSECQGKHKLNQYFHIAPGFYAEIVDDGIQVIAASTHKKVAFLQNDKKCSILLHINDNISHYSNDFGLLKKCTVIQLVTDFSDEIDIKTKIVFF